MDIRIPLDRALDLLVALPPTSEAAKWLRARIIDTALRATGYVCAEPTHPEKPTPWTPKVGESVVTRYGEVGVVVGVDLVRGPGLYVVRYQGEDGVTFRYLPSSDLRPAEDAR